MTYYVYNMNHENIYNIEQFDDYKKQETVSLTWLRVGLQHSDFHLIAHDKTDNMIPSFCLLGFNEEQYVSSS